MIRTLQSPPEVRTRRFENALPIMSGRYTVVTTGSVPALLKVGRVSFENSPEIVARRSRQREAQRATNVFDLDQRSAS